MFGVRLGDGFDVEKLQLLLKEQKISVSLRGTAIRVAPNIYNYKEEVEALGLCFEKARRRVFY